MIRQKAFIKEGRFLKGGLHCHTTRSDGKGSPEETMALHKENGYDFLALTDHRRYNYKNFDPSLDLLIIPGMEFDNGKIKCKHGFRCFHTVCIGPLKEDGNGFDQSETPIPSAVAQTQEEYQPYLDDIHAKNNLTFYCHPQWSSTPARYFDKLRGNFAIEIWNSGCARNHDTDNDAAYWDELLGKGVRVFGVATDDGHLMKDHCNGWVMVKAEKKVSSILNALKEGEFYASCGPEIYDFYVDGDKAYVDCSPVKRIRLHSDAHPTKIVRGADGLITHAEFNLNPSWGTYEYVRVTVVDENENKAWSNPIFLD